MTKTSLGSLENKRIYCVVASTVQPAGRGGATVVQPLGRQIAQAAHVVSKARCGMLMKSIVKLLKGNLKTGAKELLAALTQPFALEKFGCKPVTTIILEARDSFELEHVQSLLRLNLHTVYEFLDTDQPDYGSTLNFVRTAIATEPTTKEAMEGILDYLPLWGSK